MTAILRTHPGFTRLVACLVLIAFAAGCTTMRPLEGPDPTAFASEIEVGDKVRITRSDFSAVEFEVTNVANDGIGGDGIFVPWADVQQVEIRRIDKLRTGIVVVLGAVVLAGAVLAGSEIGPISLAAPAP